MGTNLPEDNADEANKRMGGGYTRYLVNRTCQYHQSKA